MDKKDLLQFDLFAGLRDDALDRFLNTARVSSHTYPAGCLIFLQGTECDALHLLLKGSAKATMNNAEGKKIIIEQIQAPCILAPAALFATNSNYPVNIEANETCVIAFIQKSDFADLMQRESSVMQAFIRILADKSICLAEFAGTVGKLPFESRTHRHTAGNRRLSWCCPSFHGARPFGVCRKRLCHYGGKAYRGF